MKYKNQLLIIAFLGFIFLSATTFSINQKVSLESHQDSKSNLLGFNGSNNHIRSTLIICGDVSCPLPNVGTTNSTA